MLTVSEVAKELRVHPVTVYRWVESGFLPAVKIGTRIRIKEEDLKRFLATKSTNRTEE